MHFFHWLPAVGMLVLIACPLAGQRKLPTAYLIDTQHSRVEFRVRFMGLSTVRGEFGVFSGTILTDDDPTRSSVTVAIRTTSINTHATARDEHLRSPDFLDAARHPNIMFRSSRVERTASGFVAHGTLRMRGISRTIALPFVQVHAPTKDAWRNDRVTYQSEIRLSRRDYGIPGTAFWNAEYDPGRFAVADTVHVELEISATIPNAARWTIPGTDSLVSEVERRGATPVLNDMAAVRDTANESASAVVVTAYKLLQRGRRAEAIEVFEWAAERFSSNPQLPMALGILGEAYLQAGRRTDAVRVFEQVLGRDPYDARALEWLSWLGVRGRSVPGS